MGGGPSKKSDESKKVAKYPGNLGRQLIEAVKVNDLEVVDEIIASIDLSKTVAGKEHKILDAKDYDWMRPLHWAAFKGHQDCLQKLIDGGSWVEAQNKDGRRPLHRAANAGKAECVAFLIDYGGADPECANRDGWRPLHRGANNGQLESVTMLLNKGAEKEPETVFGSRPLHFASEKGHLPLVKLFANKEDDAETPGWGCDINAANKNGLTPLHKAAQFSQKEVLKFLLSKGAIKTLKDKDGRTPLDCAGEYGGLRDKRPIVSILSGEGKKKKKKPKKGGLFGGSPKKKGSLRGSLSPSPKKPKSIPENAEPENPEEGFPKDVENPEEGSPKDIENPEEEQPENIENPDEEQPKDIENPEEGEDV
mmetsp:Transcript_50281/g.101165  ORF Transcript_50281/g.101165 Transcript_50281/m.101165 type:complete len:365 (-) Transcript_50281:200-1294(-)